MNVQDITRLLPPCAKPIWHRLVNAMAVRVPVALDPDELVGATLGQALMLVCPDAFADALHATYWPELPPPEAVAKARRDEAEAEAARMETAASAK